MTEYVAPAIEQGAVMTMPIWVATAHTNPVTDVVADQPPFSGVVVLAPTKLYPVVPVGSAQYSSHPLTL